MASLERRLGLFSVITISISSMIGSGIFVLPGLGFQMTGPSLALAFLASAFCILPAAMSKAELATAMPTSGGTYVYLERTFGPLVGTVSGLGLFLSILLKASFSLYGIGAYLNHLSHFPLEPTMLSFLAVIILLNILGVGKVSNFLTTILFITVISLIVLCIYSIPSWDIQRLTPAFTNGANGFFIATATVFVSFAGVTKIAAIAEEVKDPEKNLPRGILISLALVSLIYVSICVVLSLVIPMDEIANSKTPIYDLAHTLGGVILGGVFALIAALTLVNTANAGVLAGSRFPFAMSRDKLLPSFIGKLHPKFITPITSIILSGIIICTALLTLDITKIAKLASAFMILGYMSVNASVIVLRELRTNWYKPKYKSPLYPGLQIFGILSGGVLLASMGQLALYAILGIAIPGLFLYVFYSRKQMTRKGVLGIRGKRVDLIQETSLPLTDEFCSFEVTGEAKVVVGLFGSERSSEMLIEMGLAMAQHTHVEVAQIIELPEQTDLHDMIDEPGQMRSLRRRVTAMANDKNESITFDMVPSHDISKTIFDISQRLSCEWLLIEWGGKTRGNFTVHNPIGWLKSHLQSNLAVFRDAGVRYIRKILVVINNDSNDKLALETADHLAEVFWADITLARYVNPNDSNEKKDYEVSYLNELGKKLKSKNFSKLVEGSNYVTSILDYTCDYDLLILGSKDFGLVDSLKGTAEDKIMAKASCSVLTVHKATPNA